MMTDRHDQIRQRAEQDVTEALSDDVLRSSLRSGVKVDHETRQVQLSAEMLRQPLVDALVPVVATLSDRLASLEGQNETLNALVEEKEVSWIQDVLDHWFIQGGVAQFGWPQRDGLRPANADELVSQILEVVRATIALPPPPSPETRE